MIDVDFLLLADYAEITGGKLYMAGGGWDTLTLGEFPQSRNVGVALGIGVPWDETNRRYRVHLEIRNEDTGKTLTEVEGEFETGRPAGVPAGTTQLIQIALNGPINFEEAGGYIIECLIDGVCARRRPFRVVDARPRSKP